MKNTGRPNGRLRVGRVLLFAVLFCVVLSAVQQVLNHKYMLSEYWPQRFDTYKALPADTVDVVFLGTSLSQGGVSPNVLWNEAGVASYNMSGSAHQHTFDEQKLLVMLEMNTPPKYAVFTPTSLFGEPFYNLEVRTAYHKLVSALPGPVAKVRAALAMKDDLHAAGEPFSIVHFALPLLDYHSRWNALKTWDFEPAWTYADQDPPFMLGQVDTKGQTDITDKRKADKAKTELDPVMSVIWQRIFGLCRDNGITPVVLLTPRFDGAPSAAQRQAAAAFCEQNGALLIDYMTPQELARMGWDYTADFAEPVHLNMRGSIRLSADLARQLAALPGVDDHRGDPAYAVWDEYRDQYYETYGEIIADVLGEQGAQAAPAAAR